MLYFDALNTLIESPTALSKKVGISDLFEDAIEFLKEKFNKEYDGTEATHDRAFLSVDKYILYIGTVEGKEPVKLVVPEFIQFLGGHTRN